MKIKNVSDGFQVVKYGPFVLSTLYANYAHI